MAEPVVRVVNVSKRFRLGETTGSLRDLIGGGLRRVFGAHRTTSSRTRFAALDGISFEVPRGEAFGIIGPNGAGKSTMLKLLAGILRPDAGHIAVSGRLAALIEVGAGFHGDLTGRENIFLNGAILGMSRGETRQKLDAIVSFAGIERFLDMPVKRYSSGMYARLGFSIAAHVDPAVLLVDEVLSVGDAVFRLRCVERMRELVRTGTTLVFVTHNLDQMQSICRRAMVLEAGRCAFMGDARDAVGRYMDAMSRAYAARPADVPATDANEEAAVSLLRFSFQNQDGAEVTWIRPTEPVRAELLLEVTRPVPRLVVELNMRASVHENVVSLNSGRDGQSFQAGPGRHRVTVDLPRIPLAGGQYFWNVRVWDASSGETLLDTPFQRPMAIDDQGRATGVVTLDREWTFAPHDGDLAPIDPVACDTNQTEDKPTREHLLLR